MKYIQHEGERHVVIANNSSICPCDGYRSRMLIYNEERKVRRIKQSSIPKAFKMCEVILCSFLNEIRITIKIESRGKKTEAI